MFNKVLRVGDHFPNSLAILMNDFALFLYRSIYMSVTRRDKRIHTIRNACLVVSYYCQQYFKAPSFLGASFNADHLRETIQLIFPKGENECKVESILFTYHSAKILE